MLTLHCRRCLHCLNWRREALQLSRAWEMASPGRRIKQPHGHASGSSLCSRKGGSRLPSPRKASR